MRSIRTATPLCVGLLAAVFAQPTVGRAAEPMAAQQPGGPRTSPPPAPDAEPEVDQARARRRSNYRDPMGSILLGITGGASVGSGVQYGNVGVQIGYAVLTGVVPGIRGTGYFGGLTGGEVVGTLWLTPPLELSVVPFAVGEIGYVWQEVNSISTNGALYGAGGGLHFGRPTSSLQIRAGVVYRFFDFGGGSGFVSPLVVGSFRL